MVGGASLSILPSDHVIYQEKKLLKNKQRLMWTSEIKVPRSKGVPCAELNKNVGVPVSKSVQ